jgi:hypothetical protein
MSCVQACWHLTDMMAMHMPVGSAAPMMFNNEHTTNNREERATHLAWVAGLVTSLASSLLHVDACLVCCPLQVVSSLVCCPLQPVLNGWLIALVLTVADQDRAANASTGRSNHHVGHD